MNKNSSHSKLGAKARRDKASLLAGIDQRIRSFIEQKIGDLKEDVARVIRSESAIVQELIRTNHELLEDTADDDTDQLLNKDQAAERLNVSPRTVDTLIHSGEIASIKIRGCRRILPEALDAYIERLAREEQST